MWITWHTAPMVKITLNTISVIFRPSLAESTLMKRIMVRDRRGLTRDFGTTKCTEECSTLKHRDDIRRNFVWPVDINGIIVVNKPKMSLEVLLRYHPASDPAREVRGWLVTPKTTMKLLTCHIRTEGYPSKRWRRALEGNGYQVTSLWKRRTVNSNIAKNSRWWPHSLQCRWSSSKVLGVGTTKITDTDVACKVNI